MITTNIKFLVVVLSLTIYFQNSNAYSQGIDGKSSDSKTDITNSTGMNKTGPDNELHKDIIRYTGLTAVYPVTFIIGVKAWQWGSNHQFQFGSEHWFGQNTGLGGADKAGHLYAFYMVQRLLFNVFDYTENGKNTKWLYSMFTTFSMGLMLEVGDGWSSTYGFSKEDLIIDTIGILFGALLDYSPVLDAFLGLSIEYMPTRGFINHRKSVLDFENDYSGWKYMMNFRMAGFNYLWKKTPEFFRYVQFDLGYFVKGYSPHYDKNIPEYNNNTRNWFAGISINLSEVVNDFYSDKNSRAARITRKPFEYVHVPAGYRREEVIR